MFSPGFYAQKAQFISSGEFAHFPSAIGDPRFHRGVARNICENGELRTRSEFRFYDVLVSAFVVVLLISNLVGGKICAFGSFRIGGAELLFPITYIFGDVFTEVYGYAASRRAIWIGFFASALLAVVGVVIVALPPAPEWGGQAAYATVFHFVPRLVIASLAAFWAGEFANSYVMAKMKIFTRGRHLWSRTLGSTVVGQAVDTSVLMILAFGITLKASVVLNLIATSYLFKVIYEAAATPLTYAVVNFLKRVEGVDTYDYDTKFNPFATRV